MERKFTWINTRLTPKQKEVIKQAAGYRPTATYIKECIEADLKQKGLTLNV